MDAEPRSLEVFQDLLLRGPSEGRPALRKALIERVSAPWRHAEEEEAELSRHSGDRPDVLVFEREAADGLASAGLVLWARPEGYEVSNIVPRDVRKLGYRAYNGVLRDFLRRIATPAAQQVGFAVETTSPVQTLEEWLTPQAAMALRRFSDAANKATGSSHPRDRDRWFQFLLQVHADSRRLDSEQLSRWLTELEGWSPDEAHDLVVQYEFGLGLLEKSDQYRV